MAKIERGKMNVSGGRVQGASFTMERWECDEKDCKFKLGPITAEQAAILRKAHLKTHGRKP